MGLLPSPPIDEKRVGRRAEDAAQLGESVARCARQSRDRKDESLLRPGEVLAIGDRMAEYIQDQDVRDEPPSGLADFEVRR